MKAWRSDTQKLASYLCYRGIFNSGLSEDDILKKCHWGKKTTLTQNLVDLETAGAIKKVKNSYFVTSVDPNLLGVPMNVRASNSEKLIKLGEPFYRFLQSTGCVMLIAISGSASHANVVNTEEKEADLDIFLVCKPATMQIMRMINALYVRFIKIAKLFGRADYPRFCVNTLMDFESLQVQNCSIFTAFDLLNLRIITGEQTFNLLKKKNAWTQKYFSSNLATDRECEDAEPAASPVTRFVNWIVFLILALRSTVLAPFRGSDMESISFSTAYARNKSWCLYHQNHLGGGHQSAIARRFAEIYSENFEEDPELYEFLFPGTIERGTWKKNKDSPTPHIEIEKADSYLGYR